MTCGCVSVADSRASSRNMRSSSGSSACCGRIRLSTTSFSKPSMPTPGSRARKISAMPPTARRRIGWYRPMRWPLSMTGATASTVPEYQSLRRLRGRPLSAAVGGAVAQHRYRRSLPSNSRMLFVRGSRRALICRSFGVAQHVAVFPGFFAKNPRHAWGWYWTRMAPLLRNEGYEGERHMRDKVKVRTLRGFASLLPLALLAPIAGSCSDDGHPTGTVLPKDVTALIFLQRTPRGDQGNVFDYTSYAGGGRLVKLAPAAADGTLTTLFPTAQTCTDLGMDASCVGQVDIMSYDINFNADRIVFSASFGGRYQLYSVAVDGTDAKQLTDGGNDYVYPIYLPGGKIMFMTNLNVEQVADANSTSQQFTDEYERATTAQVGTISIDGSNETLGARNVSHRVSPAMLPDGQIVYTEWRHMGMVNDGHLRMMNTDLTGMKEAFGGELTGQPSTNSYLKARFVSKTMINNPDGTGQIANYQMVAIATSRDRTLQSGKLFLIDLNGSEVRSTAKDLTRSEERRVG